MVESRQRTARRPAGSHGSGKPGRRLDRETHTRHSAWSRQRTVDFSRAVRGHRTGREMGPGCDRAAGYASSSKLQTVPPDHSLVACAHEIDESAGLKPVLCSAWTAAWRVYSKPSHSPQSARRWDFGWGKYSSPRPKRYQWTPLHGVWELVSLEDVQPDGMIVYTWGKAVSGTITYTPGRTSVCAVAR